MYSPHELLYRLISRHRVFLAAMLCAALTQGAFAAGAPTITSQPQNQTVFAGETASFSVTATGTPTPSYQWRRNGTNISGATNATYTKANAQAADAGTYTVYVSNTKGNVTSIGATLTVNATAAPAITSQPLPQTVDPNQSFTFTVSGTGTPAPTYQWLKDGFNISGATSATYAKANAGSSDKGLYSVRLTNIAGFVVSASARLAIRPAAPTSVGISNVTGTSIAVVWTHSPSTITNYIVSVDGTDVATVDKAVTTYTYNNAVPDTLYFVQVRAFDGEFSSSAIGGPVTTKGKPVFTSGNYSIGEVGMALGVQLQATNNPTSYGVTGLPSGFTINPSTGLISGIPIKPGTYSGIIVSASNSAGTTTAAFTLYILAGLPYTTDFELAEGFSVGSLQSQLGWSATGTATVSGVDHYSGNYSALLGATSPITHLDLNFKLSGPDGVVFLDFFAKPMAGVTAESATIFSGAATKFALQKSNQSGILYAYIDNGMGGGSWESTGFSTSLDANNATTAWTRFTARADFTRQKWDLYGNGQMVAANLILRRNNPGLSFQMNGAGGLDYFYAAATNPLFPDVNNNGIEDAWETSYSLLLANDNRDLSPTGNGITVIQAYVGGTDPNDWYNGVTPVLSVVGGNNQTTASGEFNSLPFHIAVSKPVEATPWTNAPVTFTVAQGGGSLSTENVGSPPLYSSLTVRTDADGAAKVYYKQPAGAGVQSQVQVGAGSAAPIVMLTSSSPIGGTDTDSDGLTDTWEQQYFGGISQMATADPDGDGFTNLLEFILGRNPTKGAVPDAAGAVNLRVYSPTR